MAVAIGPEHTTLWDQIVYSGAPEEFLWVLPVDSTMTEVAVADERFFVELDAATAPVVIGPTPEPFEPGCGSCGDDSGATGGPPGANEVTVHDQAVVGPYETVTISSRSATSLVDWLHEHDYALDETTTPLLDGYVALGMAFVVVRLRPGRGVQSMQPLRIRYQGSSPLLPLRMVAAGVADRVSLYLWVFGEGRYEPANYGNALLDARALAVGYFESNWEQLYEAAIAQMRGRGWVTESAIGAATAGTEGAVRTGMGAVYTSRSSPEWAVAMEGLSDGAVVTRLRTTLSASALDQDLVLAPATAGPDLVPRVHRTSKTLGSASFPAAPVLAVLALFGVLVSERWRRWRARAS